MATKTAKPRSRSLVSAAAAAAFALLLSLSLSPSPAASAAPSPAASAAPSPTASAAPSLAPQGGLRLHGQAPYPFNVPIAASSSDRIFLSAQTSNGVAVVDPFGARLLGVVPLGAKLPETLSALYRGQAIVHGSGFSPDRRTVAAVCVGSDAVAFLDATGAEGHAVLSVTSVGRSPHEASWSPSGDEVWIAVRGENLIQILDGRRPFAPLGEVRVPEGPGMVAFSPDGRLAFVCSSFTPETVVVNAATREVVASIEQASAFCPNLAVTPDGEQVGFLWPPPPPPPSLSFFGAFVVRGRAKERKTQSSLFLLASPSLALPAQQLWFTLKDSGKTQVVEAKEPFRTIAVLETGSVTNHVNFAVPPTPKGTDGGAGKNATTTPKTLAFVSVGGEGKILVFSADNVAFGSPPPKLLKTIQLPAGDDEPHAVWPSGDGTRVWVGLQISNAVVAVDTRTLEVVEGSRVEIGAQSPMGMVYVPGAASAAAPGGKGTEGAKAAAAAGPETTKRPALLSAEEARAQSKAFHFELVNNDSKNKNGDREKKVLTSLVVNQQSTFVDALEAVVAGLRPGEGYALCLTGEKEGSGGGRGEKSSSSSSLSSCEEVVFEFKGGKDGAASIATVGPFTELLFKKNVKSKDGKLQQKRFFVVVPKKEGGGFGGAVQVQQQ